MHLWHSLFFNKSINNLKTKQMKIKAKFKGKDGSVGYRNGENYWLYFRLDSHQGDDFIYIEEITESVGCLTSIRKESYCEYASLKAFLNNWQVF